MGAVRSTRYRGLLARLRLAREEAGLTQEEVARAVGRPQSYVSKCETGERRLDAIELEDLARVYARPLGFFVGEAEAGQGGASLSSEAAGPYAGRSGASPRERPRVRGRRRR